MKTFVALALAATALAVPKPLSSRAGDCADSRDGTSQLSVVNVTSSAKRSIERRQLSGILTVTLEGGVLKDQAGRTGSIVANHQFQFDNPVQDNAIATSGFAICSNNSLTHDGSAIWYQCYSGGFYNLYDEEQGEQCNEIYLIATGSSSGPVSQATDGQPAATTAVPVSQITDGQPQAPTGVVSQISDGQPQAPTGVPVSQISDGQPQAPTGLPVSQISDGQPQAPTGVPVSQISDGQPQVPTGVPVSQISDGQPQVPAGVPVTQISDGQIQASTGGVAVTQISDGQIQAPTSTAAPVTQISDGQIQAPTSAKPVTQISDGQIQAPTSAVKPVTQISDGQIQAPTGGATRSANGTVVSPTSPLAYTGAAALPTFAAEMLIAAGAMAVALL